MTKKKAKTRNRRTQVIGRRQVLVCVYVRGGDEGKGKDSYIPLPPDE